MEIWHGVVLFIVLCVSLGAGIGKLQIHPIRPKLQIVASRLQPTAKISDFGTERKQSLTSVNLRLYFAESRAIQHTLQHLACPACEGRRAEIMAKEKLAALSFRLVASIWLEDKRIFVQPRTHRDNAQHVKTLSAFLGDIVTGEVHIGNIREFQHWRLASNVGHTRINHELSSLGQILTMVGTWHRIKPYYKPLPITHQGPGIALSDEQIRRLFEVARKDTRWEVALYASILSAHTTAGPGEIKGLQLCDVDIPNRLIYIRKGKNRHRVRTLPLNDESVRAVRYLLERAYEKGASQETDYLLPHRSQIKGKKYDFTRPQGHWNRAWDRIRKAAGLPKLRQYDLRHTAITRLLENPHIPERVVIELAGHVSNKMLARYSHQRMDAKRKAVQALTDLSTNLRGMKIV